MYIKKDDVIWVATANDGNDPIYLLLQMANRHGLIAGATGTGKTTTLKVLVEGFSDAGVPVFLADIKGDVASLAQPGEPNKHVAARVKAMHIKKFKPEAYPVRFWDVYGEQGIPIRTTITDMGPDLLGRLLNLNDTQQSVLKVVFKIADDNELLLIDTKDLRAVLQYIADYKDVYQKEYGNIASSTIGAIQREVLNLETSGGDQFFGEPALDILDWLALAQDGRGMINLLYGVKLVQNPALYSTFLLWMLSEIYETLPEVGDLPKPKMVFFFDEAHLLFQDAPKALLDKVNQVVRLIRSKGVGIYFITQQPDDIPDTVLSQLGNKLQHALRAYTPKDQKSVKAAAASFRPNPAFTSEQVLGELATGEALVSLLDEKGTPSIVERAFILPPQSYMGTVDATVIATLIGSDGMEAKYRKMVDNPSAFEAIAGTREQIDAALSKTATEAKDAAAAEKAAKAEAKAQEKAAEKTKKRVDRMVDRVLMNALGSAGRQLGGSITRGLFGSRRRK
jgi:hypothetical protein